MEFDKEGMVSESNQVNQEQATDQAGDDEKCGLVQQTSDARELQRDKEAKIDDLEGKQADL